MLESGYQISSDYVSFYNVYKGMVDAELARPAQAEVSASYYQMGNHLEADVVVQNLSGVRLSSTDNKANVGLMVYEDARVGLTRRYMRAVGLLPITSALENGASATYRVVTNDVDPATNWSKLHAIAFVDYRPGVTTGAYDMLQAAAAAFAPSFSVSPSSLSFTVNQEPPNDPEATINLFGGPAGTPWTVTSKPSWLTVIPGSGVINTSATVRVDGSMLQDGNNTGTIHFSATAGATTMYQEVSVSATYTPPTPDLNIQPASLSFAINQEPANDPQVTIQVGGTPAGATWTIESKPNWASVVPSSGTIGTQAVVWVDGSALQVGTTTGQIRFTTTFHGKTDYQDVPLTVTYAAPDMTISPSGLGFLVDQEPPNDPETVMQINGTLAGTFWTVESKPDWVSVTPANGTVNRTAVVRVDGSALEVGNNTGTIRFTAVSAGVTLTRDIPVSATYNPPPPRLTSDRSKVVFFIDPYDPVEREVTINFTGSPSDLIWQLDSAPEWTTVTPTTGVLGSSSATAKIVIVTSNLTDGDNVGTIQFSASKYGMTTYQKIDVVVFYQKYVTYYFPIVKR